MLDRELLTDNKKAPVDPKFWDRVNRGEETDNPPHKDRGPPPNSEGFMPSNTHVHTCVYTLVYFVYRILLNACGVYMLCTPNVQRDETKMAERECRSRI